MWLGLAGLLVFAPCAWAQLQAGENSTLHLNGMASLGYRSVFDSTDTNSLAWGFSGNLTGEYYDPRFLNFSVSPYINQSRLNSNYYSTTTATGVNAVANFLSGSHTPMQFSYERDHNSEGTFNVPGSTGNYKTVDDYQDTRTDAPFDTVGALLMMKPTPRFGVNFSVNYSSNLSAQFLSGILGGSIGATVGSGAVALKPESQNPTFTSNYLTYGTVASYRATRELTFTGNINRQVQGQPGQPDATSTSMGGGAVWSHEFLGGTLGAHYAIAHYFVPLHAQSFARSSTFTGPNTGVSYSRLLLGWSASTSFSYARSLTPFLVGYVRSNYTANVSVSRVIGTWSLGLNGSYSRARVENITLSNSLSTNYGASLAHRNYGVSGGYSHSSGSGLQVGNSIVPVPSPTTGLLPNYFVLFGGDAYTIGANYRPLRRWSIDGSYSHLRYFSNNLSNNVSTSLATAKNTSDQFLLRSQYSFRQLQFFAGVSHLSQGFMAGSTLTNPAKIDTFYVGVSRRFDFF